MDSGDDFFFHHFIDSSDDSSSDDEDLVVAALVVHDHIERQLPRYRGSVPDRAPNLDRNRERGHALLYVDYFANTPLFMPDKFRRRFRMARHLFNRIREGVVAHDPYFECKMDALGKHGFSSYQKCTAAIRMLAYGIPGDLVDEYVHMSESTCLLSLYNFCKAVVAVFGPEYLRQPNAADTERLLATNATRGSGVALRDSSHWILCSPPSRAVSSPPRTTTVNVCEQTALAKLLDLSPLWKLWKLQVF
nr:uncharacterized protein LOC109781306 [Aegilops tauschii subsp. strangulata]